MPNLWEPVSIGRTTLRNRLVMGPMTRDRSTPEGTPTPLNADYYAQRASFGMIITEGTQPSDDGQGYFLTPGIDTDAVGRIAHPSNTTHGRRPVAPSAVRPAGKMFTTGGPQEMPEPRELTLA